MCWTAGKRSVRAHDLARNFQSKVGTASSLKTAAPFSRVIPGTVSSYSEEPRATCPCLGWGDGRAGQHQPSPVFPLQGLLSSQHLGTEVSPPACPGSPSPSARRRSLSLPPALRAGAAGLAPEAAGRCWCWAWPRSQGPWLEPPSSRSAGEEAHTAQAGKVLWGPRSPLLPALLLQPGPLAGALAGCGAFSQSPGARRKVGTGSARAYQQDL